MVKTWLELLKMKVIGFKCYTNGFVRQQGVEKYYLANKHLPEIPSEKEVIENGIDLAEMNKLLLKKIEEMTIILVNQQKQIDDLKIKLK